MGYCKEWKLFNLKKVIKFKYSSLPVTTVCIASVFTQACSGGPASLREKECAKYRTSVQSEHNYTWEPFIHRTFIYFWCKSRIRLHVLGMKYIHQMIVLRTMSKIMKMIETEKRNTFSRCSASYWLSLADKKKTVEQKGTHTYQKRALILNLLLLTVFWTSEQIKKRRNKSA